MIDVVDSIDWKKKDVNYKNQHSKVKDTQQQARSFGFQTCKVTYGGVDGAYYTSTRTRRTGNDGVSNSFGVTDLLLVFSRFNVVFRILGVA